MNAGNPPLVVYVEVEYAASLEAGFRHALRRHGVSPRDVDLLLLDVFYPRAGKTPEEQARNRIYRADVAQGAEIPQGRFETERQAVLRLFAPGGVALASRLRAAGDFDHAPVVLYYKDLESASKILRFVGDRMGAR